MSTKSDYTHSKRSHLTRPDVENRITAAGIRAMCALLLMWLSPALTPLYGQEISFTADRTSVALTEGRERTVLTGNARIETEDQIVTANEIEIWGEDFRFARARGSVTVLDTGNNIDLTSEELFLDRDSDRMQAQGAVILEDRENEIVVKGAYLELLDEGDTVIVQVGVRILREDLTTRSEFARFDRASGLLSLSGLPVAFWRGDEYRASRIVIDTERDEITLQGEVQGSVTSGSEDEGSAE